MTQYHDTQYGFFHILLPLMLRSDMFPMFVEASVRGEGHAMLVGFWRTAARQASGVGANGQIPRELDLTRDSFAVDVVGPIDGIVQLVMTGPPVREALEVCCAIGAFAESDPSGSFRYFTCEAPMDKSFPWMVGEWHADGSRSNLGAIADPSPRGMVEIVGQLFGKSLGHSQKSASPPTAPPGRDAGIREIPDVDALLRGGPRPSPEGLGSPHNDPFGGPKERVGAPQAGSQPIATGKLGSTFRSLEDDPASSHSIPLVAGAITSNLKWEATPLDLANDAALNLYRLHSRGGTALVLSATKAKGLGKKTSSYVQFMWNPDTSLIVEVQADYSYWGLSIPSSSWPILNAAGLKQPDSESANFHLMISAGAIREERVAQLSRVFESFQRVLQPSGRIKISSF